jgi:hypothetical protein
LAFGAGRYLTSQQSGKSNQSSQFTEFNEEMQGKEEEDAAALEMMVIERPRSWGHLIKTLFTVDEYRLLKLQNADGYFYLLYLKYSAILFGLSKS